ncbi:MAG: adenylate/guanylate cyclase domain-containing protein, partial [Bacteroidota bacterium]
FKAGLHSGLVTVTEIGKLKKEIAYHGDTINTAARIQEKCNDFQQELLISDQLRRQLSYSQTFAFTPMGAIRLKGKQAHTQVYAVSPHATSDEEPELTIKQHSKTVYQLTQC